MAWIIKFVSALSGRPRRHEASDRPATFIADGGFSVTITPD